MSKEMKNDGVEKRINAFTNEFISITARLLQSDLKDSGKKMVDIIDSFGSERLKIIDDSWFSRNLEDEILTLKIPSKYWKRFRNPEWVAEHILEQ